MSGEVVCHAPNDGILIRPTGKLGEMFAYLNAIRRSVDRPKLATIFGWSLRLEIDQEGKRW